MAVLLVRHALAVPRRKWDGPDELRPLTKRGERQAAALALQLRRRRVDQIRSSPSLRCVETVRPLADARGLAVDKTERLGEGTQAQALELVVSLVGKNALLCSHGDVLIWVLQALRRDGLAIDKNFPCAKGSTWVLRGSGRRFRSATYLPPPG